MPASDGWARFGLDENEAGALLQAADRVANSFDVDPDVRGDVSQDVLYHALKLLKRQREGNPPRSMPDSGLDRIKYLATAMRNEAIKTIQRRAYDTPLDHSGRPHSKMQHVEYDANIH